MSVPTKWLLAQHWQASPDRNTYAPMLDDLADPCCFVCGWYSEHWVKVTPKASWERATLERAHIVPRSLGGSDDASNVILLCSPCHRDSPDWHDPSAMARWIAGRPDRASKEVEEFSDWAKAALEVPEFQALLAEYEANPDMTDEEGIQRILEILRASTRRATTHNVSLSSGTKGAILRDAVDQATAT